MNKTALALTLVATAFLTFLDPAPAHAQATRTWVSGVGDDVNPCSRTAPCKTFAGAISKTAVNGEINCLDPGGFGALTITKSITVDCEGTYGSTLAAGGNGFIINATAGSRVRLRGISINGSGGSGGITGTNGIRWVGPTGVLHVENVKIFNFTTTGIDLQPSGNLEVFVSNTDISDVGTLNTHPGINIKPVGTTQVIAAITHTRLHNNGVGIIIGGAGTGMINTLVRDSVISGNAFEGLASTSTAALLVVSIDQTAIYGNTTGVRSSGTDSNVRLANSIVWGNATGLTAVSNGKIISFSSNVFNGNFVADGAPTLTLPSQ